MRWFRSRRRKEEDSLVATDAPPPYVGGYEAGDCNSHLSMLYL